MRQLKITKQVTNRETASLDKYLQEIGKVDLITADEEVELAEILDPFSNSREPLFQDIIPCCIHLGKFSYASCNLPSRSLAVDALFAKIATLTLSLKTA